MKRLFILALAAALVACLAPPPAPTATLSPALSRAAASAMVVVSPDGKWLAAANPDSGSVSLADLARLRVAAEIATGADPRSVAFTPGGTQLLVANRGSGTVSVVDAASGREVAELRVGSQPYGIVAGSGRAYASLEGEAQVVVLDLTALAVTARLPVEAFPAGLALTADETALYVTHLYSGRVTVVDTAGLAVRGVIAAEPEANLAQALALSPDESHAYLPLTYSRAGNPHLAYDTIMLPCVAVLHLAPGRSDLGEPLNVSELDRPVNLPFAALVSSDGARLYTANAGSDDVSVIDLATRTAAGHLETGRNPRGLALSPDGAWLYVNNVLDGTLDVFDARSLAHRQTLPLTTIPLPAPVLAGKRLFNSALPPMSRDHWVSCAGCHLDGGADGRTWLGFPDGPRNTPSLLATAQALPLHWNGNFDGLQDVEHTIRTIQGGDGLLAGDVFAPGGAANAGRSEALDALAAYLKTLEVPAAPNGAPVDVLERGERAFRRWGCAACHPAPLFTDRRAHASGIGDAALERNQPGPLPVFDTPALLGAWATGPYFHDGSALTLRDTLFASGFHGMGYAMDAQEVEDLVAFMMALP